MHTITARSIRRRQEKMGHRPKKKNEMPHEFYTTDNGVERVRVLHPTKGWRDRNVNCLMAEY